MNRGLGFFFLLSIENNKDLPLFILEMIFKQQQDLKVNAGCQYLIVYIFGYISSEVNKFTFYTEKERTTNWYKSVFN